MPKLNMRPSGCISLLFVNVSWRSSHLWRGGLGSAIPRQHQTWRAGWRLLLFLKAAVPERAAVTPDWSTDRLTKWLMPDSVSSSFFLICCSQHFSLLDLLGNTGVLNWSLSTSSLSLGFCFCFVFPQNSTLLYISYLFMCLVGAVAAIIEYLQIMYSLASSAC